MGKNIVHILNRGVEKRKLFLTAEDYFRFIYSLVDFNSTQPAVFPYSFRRKKEALEHLAMRRPTENLLDILCWCLMTNHFHILAQEKIDKSSGSFSKKITGGYTQYFNLKNERSGVLFQGRTKIIPVNKNEHFLYLPYYTFSNPVKVIEPDWKEKGIKNFDKVIKFLETYRWSAYLDVIGKENLPFVINRKLFFEIFDTDEKRFKKNFIDWLLAFVK